MLRGTDPSSSSIARTLDKQVAKAMDRAFKKFPVREVKDKSV